VSFFRRPLFFFFPQLRYTKASRTDVSEMKHTQKQHVTAATTALLPGGVSVVGAAAAALSPPSSSSCPPSSSLLDLASAAAKAARAAGGASAGSVAAAVDSEGAIVWLCGGEQVEVAEGEEAATEATAATLPPPLLLSPAVAALAAPPTVDPWLCQRFSSVRCGPLRVGGGLAGAAACLAELCGDGDDPGDAAFVVDLAECSLSSQSSSSSSSRPLLLAGDGPAPQSSSLLAPLRVAPHASPPPPPPVSLRGSASSSGPPPAPTAVFEPGSCSSEPSSDSSNSELLLDALALYPKSATAGEAAAALRVALSRQLRAAMGCSPSSSSSSSSSSSNLRAFPFLLPGLPVFVTPLMPCCAAKKSEAGEEKNEGAKKERASSSSSSSPSEAARASLGRRLRVPAGLPFLRPSAAFAFPSLLKTKKKRREKLLNVHLSLPSFCSSSKSSSPSAPLSPFPFKPPLPESPTLSAACVAGNYRYHHYGQDSKDDRGWGCAYRSLQTLWSWFEENHFLNNDDEDDERRRKRPPPSHAEIQRALVSLGDKPASFVNSNQWIGALEISYVLDHLAGVQSKVITVASGKEMSSSQAAGALVSHFAKQGTPVMIGGGVLAYTCLGCCYDSASGEASFLILDPHYCGTSDDNGGGGEKESAATAAAAAVVKGGWCSWKKPGDSAAAGGPLFVDDAFYNLLCPQRP
jgi:Ufm1-specific protease 2